ncbi:hypothetical protein ACFLQJ_01640 [Calditrichota bacterium]
MKAVLFTGLILLVATTGFSQQLYDLDWDETYGGNSTDYFTSLIETPDGDFVMAGQSQSFGNGWEIYVVKVDSDGDEIWSNHYGGADSEEFPTIIMTDDGGYAIAATTRSFGAGENDLWLLKLDEGGDSLWAHAYGTEGFEGWSNGWTPGLIELSEGGFAMTIPHMDDQQAFWEAYVVVADENGDTLWTSFYGTDDHHDDFLDVIEVEDGDIVLAGATYSWDALARDIWLLKIDPENGEITWNSYLGDMNWESAYAITHTEDEGFATIGFYQVINQEADIVLFKVDEEGTEDWTQIYGGDEEERAFDLIQLSSGGYALAASTFSFTNNDYQDGWLIITDENGDSLWSDTQGGIVTDQYLGITEIEDDSSLVVTGVTYILDGVWSLHGWLLKYKMTHPPGSFDLASPEDGSNLPEGIATVSWYPAPDMDEDDELEYIIEWSLDPVFPDDATEMGTTGDTSFTINNINLLLAVQCELDDLPDDTTIYWRVKATDSYDWITLCSADTAGWSFNIDIPESPEAFRLLTPSNGSNLDTLQPTLTWELTTDPDPYDSVHYDIWIDLNNDMSTAWQLADSSAETMLTIAEDELEPGTTYYWKVRATDSNTDGTWSRATFVFVTPDTDAVSGRYKGIPTEYSIVSTYPNPFNPTMTAVISLPQESILNARIVNVIGEEVAVLGEGNFAPGYHRFVFDASGYPTGIYFIHAEVPGKMNEVRKIVLMK